MSETQAAPSMELQVGMIVWVAGKGPMKIVKLPHPPRKTTITVIKPSGYHHWIGESEIVKKYPATVEHLEFHISELRRNGMLDGIPTLEEWVAELKEKESR